MAEKAILVTNDNQKALESRFHHDGTGVVPAVGYYLVMQFGEDGDYDVVSAAVFNAKYDKGMELRNGFFEAVRKIASYG